MWIIGIAHRIDTLLENSHLRVAITGAGGRVGTYLAKRVAANSHLHEPVAICRNFLAAKKLRELGCTVRVGSILDPSETGKLLADCDTVVHCAQSSEGLGRRDSHNLRMIRSVRQVGSVKTLIYMSSIAVYGNCIESGGDSYARPCAVDAYGKDKLICEREVMHEFSVRGRQAVVLRLGHVYGAFQLWSRQILSLARNGGFRLPFAGRLLSNAVSIGGVGDAVGALLEAPPRCGIYNLTANPQRTWSDVFRWHTKSCGIPPVPSLQDDESLTIRRKFLDAKRTSLRQYLGTIVTALRAAGLEAARSNPLLRDAGSALVACTPALIEDAIRRKYRRALVQQINGEQRNIIWEPGLGWLFSDPVPGAYLEWPAAESIGSEDEGEMQHELSRWFIRWSLPDGIWRN